MRWVGRRVRAVDWDSKTSGRERFAADVAVDGRLIGRILRSPLPHAAIVSIDTDAARRMPGVHAVVTMHDLVPGALYEHSGGDLRDRHPLAVGRVRYIGEEVAAVAAETPEMAAAALAAIDVRYRPLRPVLTVDAALRGSTRIHDRGAAANVALELSRCWGDIDAGTRRSVWRARRTFTYPRVAHAPLEPNTTLASWDVADEIMHVWTSSQSPWFVADEIERTLGIPFDRVVCHDVSTGGGFGSKSHISEHEVIAAALAKAAGRPVLLQLGRDEEFAATKPRHEFRIDATAHADGNGRISAFEAEMVVDNGAYNHYGPSVMAAGVRKFGSIYEPIGVQVHARLVDTTTTPGGQFRGYGGPQATFAIESLVDELAVARGDDPIEFRRRNANRPGSITIAGLRLGSVRLVECLDAVRDAIDWDARRAARAPGRGVGVAVAVHGSGAHVMEGSNRSEAIVELHADGDVALHFGGADAGTGQRTILAQIVAEELGVDIARVRVRMSDQQVFDLGAWSSRGSHMSGHAARRAAAELAGRVRVAAAEKLGCDVAAVRLAGGLAAIDEADVVIADLVPLIEGSQDGVAAVRGVHVDDRMELATAGPSTSYSASYGFAAHGVAVSVDRDTGVVEIEDYVAAHDIGRALNPMMAEGQITGAVVQGLGAALKERLLLEGGRVVNGAFVHYPLPRFADVPRIRPILVEGPEPAGPYGAKGIGEIPIVPVAPAVANAVHDAIGVRFTELPITPDKVLTALRRRGDLSPRRLALWRRPSRWQIALFRRAYPFGLERILRWGTRFARRPATGPVEVVERPTTSNEAVRLLTASQAVAVGGATDITVQRQQGLVAPTVLVATSGVAEMRAVRVDADGWTVIGAAVTLQALGCERVLPAMVRDAVSTIASAQIRATATVAGNLLQAKRCWYFRNGFPCYKRGGWTCPCYAVTGDHRFHHAVIGGHRCQATTPSDLATVFVSLGAVAVLTSSAGTRTVAVADLYSGPGESVLRGSELLTEIRLPPGACDRVGSFRKLALWDGDFAVVSVAVSADVDPGGSMSGVRVAFGGLAPTTWRAPDVEGHLSGVLPEQIAVESVTAAFDRELDRAAHPLRDNGWKLDAAVGLLRKALHDLSGAT